MLLMPDASTAKIDPFYAARTLSLICNVIDPITREAYSRDPRYVAQKAERHLLDSGIADIAFFGPEAEFYVFDHVSFDQKTHAAYYEVDNAEAYWNRGEGFGDPHARPNVGHHPRSQEGYFPVPPLDTMGDLRALMVLTLEALGVPCEFHHHEVGGPGQGEIDLRFQPLLKMADTLMLHKYVVKNVARAAGKSATFLPKPIFEENGSGMHVHQSLWKDGNDADVRRERLRAAVRVGAQLRRRRCSSTGARSWPSARPPPTATGAWSPAMRRRSTSCTPSATAPPPCASPCTCHRPRPSASSSARPTR